ncbi:sigma-54-dependent Fis family transcriptional regulator [Haliea salexigens]|uniref:sigma-54-dependent Fis family transcriptional regulator n=1 Tax=Haliea salexigens TaxID=287487 RepID=UPI0003F824F1|nr:sigma-54-dependent Fis family transcriptional regulator [Haliea salexigens]
MTHKNQQEEEDLSSFLVERFHVDLDQGTLWVDDHRMLLLQADWFSDIHKQIIALAGVEQARKTITQLGYSAGVRDANLAKKIYRNKPLSEIMLSGLQFHAFQGLTVVESVASDFTLDPQKFYIEAFWKNSIEVQTQETQAEKKQPSCWMAVGYSSGFLSTCADNEIIVREVECISMGCSSCRCIARFAENWENITEDRKYIPTLNAPEQTDNKIEITHSNNLQPALHPEAKPHNKEPVEQEVPINTPTVLGNSPTFKAVLHQIECVADTMTPIFLLGESGVGKSLLAQKVHLESPRAHAPFVTVNCATIPEALFEAELFGVRKGAFTGADASRAGRFEEAQGGTLFLDEIDTLSLASQAKLLRVIQTGAFERLGGAKTQQADIRLIAATNKDLAAAIEAGEFRKDLFFRINIFPVSIPPLRDRIDDLPLLIENILNRFSQKHGRAISGWTAEAYRAMLLHPWPGNIRELENVIERAVILGKNHELLNLYHLVFGHDRPTNTHHLWLNSEGQLISDNNPLNDDNTLEKPWVKEALGDSSQTLPDLERTLVLAAINSCEGNVAKAAKRLGVTRSQLDYRLKKWRKDDKQ